MIRNNKNPTITAHCLIRNEERWIWYAINSVIDYVDKILVYDTGSTDNTVKIIKSIKSPKIILEEKGIVSKKQFVQLRQEMLDRTDTDWFLVLDGDEVWPEKTIGELTSAVKKAKPEKEAIVVGQWICVGDVFHYSKEMAEFQHKQYPGIKGFHLTRAIKKIKDLHCIGLYGYESYADQNKINISYWNKKRLIFLKHKFFHMTFLPRSSSIKKDREVMMRAPKTHFYQGEPFPKNMEYPEAFYKKRPNLISSPWKPLTKLDQLKGIYYRSQNFLDRLK